MGAPEKSMGGEEAMIKANGLSLVTATFFLAGTMAGTGVLALASAMVQSGVVELFLIAFFSVSAAFVGTKLGICWVILEERWPEFREQVRAPYPSIAEKAVGPWGRKVAAVTIGITLYGGGCVFLVLIGNFVHNIAEYSGYDGMSSCLWMVVFAAALTPLCFPGTPNDFWPLAVGALGTTVAACLCVMIKMSIDVNNVSQANESCYFDFTNHTGAFEVQHKAPTFDGFFKAFSTTMFAFAGAPNFPTIQSDMKDRRQFFTAVLIAMAILLVIYAPMAAVGYFQLGDLVKDNIIESLCDGGVKVAAEALLLAHLISAFPIVVNPNNQLLEEMMGFPKNFTWKRAVFRTLIVMALLFISESVPSFGSILDLVGGSTVTLLTFVFPPFFYMRLVDMGAQNPDWKQRTIPLYDRLYCWFIIIVGAAGGIVSTVYAVISIVDTNFVEPCYVSAFRDKFAHINETFF